MTLPPHSFGRVGRGVENVVVSRGDPKFMSMFIVDLVDSRNVDDDDDDGVDQKDSGADLLWRAITGIRNNAKEGSCIDVSCIWFKVIPL